MNSEVFEKAAKHVRDLEQALSPSITRLAPNSQVAC